MLYKVIAKAGHTAISGERPEILVDNSGAPLKLTMDRHFNLCVCGLQVRCD